MIDTSPAERFRRALTFEPLDEVPTCEVMFALGEEWLRKKSPLSTTLGQSNYASCMDVAKWYSELMLSLEHCVLSLYGTPFHELSSMSKFVSAFKSASGSKVLVAALIGGGESTFSLNFDMGTGKDITEFSICLYERPDIMHAEAKRRCRLAIERIHRLYDCGIDVVGFSNDYAFNSGPFITPAQFHEFIIPYLTEQVAAAKSLGMLTYLHTDGGILPILDDLASTGVHAFQSIDPTAGLNLAEVKSRLSHYRIAVIGNVSCDILERGTTEEIVSETGRALTSGKPGGGFVLSSANCIYSGIPLENYKAMWETWRKERLYKEDNKPS